MNQKKAEALSCLNGTELPLLLKVPQAATLLGLSISSIDRLIGRGELKPIVKLRHRLIPRNEIERFLNAAVGKNTANQATKGGE